MHVFTRWREIAPSTGRKWRQLPPRPGRKQTNSGWWLLCSQRRVYRVGLKNDILTFDFVSVSSPFWSLNKRQSCFGLFTWRWCKYVQGNTESLQSKHVLISTVCFWVHCGGACQSKCRKPYQWTRLSGLQNEKNRLQITKWGATEKEASRTFLQPTAPVLVFAVRHSQHTQSRIQVIFRIQPAVQIAAGPIHTVFPTTEDFIPTGYTFCIYRYIYRYILWRMLWFLAVVSVSHTYFLPPVLGPRCGACVVVELRCREAKSTAREGKRVLSPAWKLLNTCNNAQCME